ncbi:hypothetical protein [Occultella kanbiaonis]|uniref:hypothetical protein n=1 Tax=Occultella kanbiaonis TaxID=2675754 RepID=UPI0013D86D7B|nr:hypothetical protein [Occultella kanbiaonis]
MGRTTAERGRSIAATSGLLGTALGIAGVYIWPFLGLPDLPSALLLVVGLAGVLIGALEWENSVVACFFPAAVLPGTAHLRRATVTTTILGVAFGLSVIALLMYQSGNWGGPYPG